MFLERRGEAEALLRDAVVADTVVADCADLFLGDRGADDEDDDVDPASAAVDDCNDMGDVRLELLSLPNEGDLVSCNDCLNAANDADEE